MSLSQVQTLEEQNNEQCVSKYDNLLKGYEDYFDNRMLQEYQESDPTHQLIVFLYQTFQAKRELYNYRRFQDYQEVFIDIQMLMEVLQCKDLTLFTNDPQSWIGSIGLALHHLLESRIVVRIYNSPYVFAIRQLKSHDIGHFIQVKDYCFERVNSSVVSVPNNNVTKLNFIKNEGIKLNDGLFQQPKQCINLECKSTQFQLDRNQCVSTLYQRIKIQELDSNEDNIQNIGRQPLTIDVELRDNIVSQFISGDHILVNGILKTEAEIEKGHQQKSYNGIFLKYILASSIFEVKENQDGIQGEDEPMTEEETNFVNQLLKRQILFPVLIASLCPTIFGQELVKAGALLCIVGGSKMGVESRASCHCLMIGDPGQGKSQILKFISLIAPRSVYVCGTATTNCGLTCSINKKEDDGGCIDAGALVLANNGICCIDEFDKMQNEHSALLEAMEQQTVSLAKSGVLCSFQAQTSIIATANPASGHYQKNKSFIDNLKIQNSILSRFDLIFLMLDQPDPLRDQKLSQHILQVFPFMNLISQLHNTKKRTLSQFEQGEKLQNSIYDEYIKAGKYECLRERLYHECQRESKTILSVKLMKKILVYIKNKIHPILTPEAGKILQDYYIRLRQQTLIASTSLPITTRQLESLIRLAQAKARYDFRDQVTKDDANFIIQLVEESKFECFMEYSEIQNQRRNKQNLDRSNVGTLSKPKQTQILLETLSLKGKQQNDFVFSVDEIKEEGRKINLQVGEFTEFLARLNDQGYLIQRDQGKYELKYNN